MPLPMQSFCDIGWWGNSPFYEVMIAAAIYRQRQLCIRVSAINFSHVARMELAAPRRRRNCTDVCKPAPVLFRKASGYRKKAFRYPARPAPGILVYIFRNFYSFHFSFRQCSFHS